MECSVCLELPEKRIPARHLNPLCRPRHIYASFVGDCSCTMVWCVWCARKAADFRLNEAIRKPGPSTNDQVEMVPCPMCRAATHPTRFITHPKPLSRSERERLVREHRPPPCWFIWGHNVCRFGRLCRNSHVGLDGQLVQSGKPISKTEWLARLPEPFYMPPSFLDRDGHAWFYNERVGTVRRGGPMAGLAGTAAAGFGSGSAASPASQHDPFGERSVHHHGAHSTALQWLAGVYKMGLRW